MKIEAIVKYIVVSFLLFANLSCKENKDETLIAKVTDLTEEEEVISDIEYDGDGRIIRYGDTPIVYAGDKVTIGKMDCLHSGNKLCSVTFKMAKGKAIESRTRCLLKHGMFLRLRLMNTELIHCVSSRTILEWKEMIS